LHAALQGHFELLLSVALTLEYEAVLKRPEQLAATRGTLQQMDTLLNAMIAVARPCIGNSFGARFYGTPMTRWY